MLNKMFNKIKAFLGLSYYTSGLDQFLTTYDRTHTLSKSQLKEREKYAKIYAKRDNPTDSSSKVSFWDSF